MSKDIVPLLTEYNKGEFSLLINEQTHEVGLSVDAYARLAGKNKSTISRRLAGCIEGGKKAQTLTPDGLRSVAFVPEKLIVEWLVDDNPKTAKNFLKVGFRTTMHTAVGYDPLADVYEPTLREQLETIGWIVPGGYLPNGL